MKKWFTLWGFFCGVLINSSWAKSSEQILDDITRLFEKERYIAVEKGEITGRNQRYLSPNLYKRLMGYRVHFPHARDWYVISVKSTKSAENEPPKLNLNNYFTYDSEDSFKLHNSIEMALSLFEYSKYVNFKPVPSVIILKNGEMAPQVAHIYYPLTQLLPEKEAMKIHRKLLAVTGDKNSPVKMENLQEMARWIATQNIDFNAYNEAHKDPNHTKRLLSEMDSLKAIPRDMRLAFPSILINDKFYMPSIYKKSYSDSRAEQYAEGIIDYMLTLALLEKEGLLKIRYKFEEPINSPSPSPSTQK
ncbi:hypothetical protein A1D22_06240 [Pasteurellaceae bacterium LFhippo2]|nr:hypothetical protein [Pasteurellaceae bacterium LFhippo2]